MTTYLAAIDRALDRDDIAAAADLAAQALATGGTEPILYNLAAWRHENEERFEDAEALLLTALRQDPRDPTLHVAIGIVRRKQGQLRASVEAFEQAIALDPGYPAAWFERGVSFEKGGAIADAADDYRRVIALEPGNAAAHAALAATEARRGQHDEARAHAERALSLDPASVQARIALAQLAMERSAADEALQWLAPLADDAATPTDAQVNVRTMLGDALHRLGRFDEAYAAYAQAQARFQAIHAARMNADAGDALSFVAGVGQSLDAADPRLWDGPATTREQPCATHVFLTGYPRSGTTLVENILATLPGALAIEERPTLGDVDRAYLSQPDGVSRLAQADAGAIASLRDGYWRKAVEAAGCDLAGRIFVDMDPFKGPRLPAIAKLFPGAKVIVMRRDPRDVVWSCFHTGFAFNAGTLAFSTLESTARHYDASWRIIETALERLPIDHFDLRYDRLVQDFDATTQALCAWLGAPWSEDLRAFDRTAKQRGVSTASATQVRQGLYDGRGAWEPYASYLAEVEPILRPWIERFEAG